MAALLRTATLGRRSLYGTDYSYRSIRSDRKPSEMKDFNGFPMIEEIERTIQADGQRLPIPSVELDSWWTNLPFDLKECVRPYRAHGTGEQFHSELKTDSGSIVTCKSAIPSKAKAKPPLSEGVCAVEWLESSQTPLFIDNSARVLFNFSVKCLPKMLESVYIIEKSE